MKLHKISSLNYISIQLDGLLWVLVQVYSFYKIIILYSFLTLTSLAGGMTGADIGLGWIDQTGQVHFQVNTKLSSLLSINTIWSTCLSIHRIDMHLLTHDPWLIIQQLIGLPFKVVNKTVGQLFNSNVLSTLVIHWMFQLKFVINFFHKTKI